jgi:hypothetical protein
MREGNERPTRSSSNFSLEILQAEDLKFHKNSAIIYSESERDVTLLLTKHYWVATYRKKEVPK